MSDKILIIEDEQRMRRVLQLVLSSQGYEVETAADGEEGIIKWKTFQPNLVFTDLKMPKADGLEVLKHGSLKYPDTPVIIFTAFGTIPAAVEAMKKGAFDYISKPVDNDIIIEKAKIALSKRKKPLSEPIQPAQPLLIGSSDVMTRLKKELELVASTNTSVLITGESGTGKELAARTIHLLSPRKAKPFVRINCAAIPRELMESELFGHTRGAFTGAVQSRKGAFIEATDGTLFLDEIGDMPFDLQSKLLHAVEDKLIIPVGSNEPMKVDVKIVSATNQDITHLIENKGFRSDLFFRLNSYTVHLWPLKERPDDIFELVDYFLTQFSRSFDQKKPAISKSALNSLKLYPWPGNVRELKNIVERLVLVSAGNPITADMVSQFISQPLQQDKSIPDLPGTDLVTHEKEIIEQVLANCGWNISRAARKLGITRNTLRYRIKKHNLASDED